MLKMTLARLLTAIALITPMVMLVGAQVPLPPGVSWI
jgi:hypothetical protein